jgi:predicted nucleic acid-binding protein
VTAYVLDASVAAKWFLPSGETLAEEAVALLKGFAAGRLRLLVPDLFWPEVGNIFWKASRGGRMSVASAREAAGALSACGIRTTPSLPLLGHALEIAAEFERTVYDSIYVALAIESNHPLVTADERLANAMAAYFPVRWLGTV